MPGADAPNAGPGRAIAPRFALGILGPGLCSASLPRVFISSHTACSCYPNPTHLLCWAVCYRHIKSNSHMFVTAFFT
jgi:hypothetical protein